jgi:aspartyl protease family protein
MSNDNIQIGKRFSVIFWILFLIIAYSFFDSQLTKQENPNQQPISYVDGREVTLVLKQNRQGHYVTTGTINGQTVTFLLDTGATTVAIPEWLAQEIGLKKGRQVRVGTANGDAVAYTTSIAELKVGDLRLRDVRASILSGMRGDQVLLGMSALKHVSFSQQGDELTITLQQ